MLTEKIEMIFCFKSIFAVPQKNPSHICEIFMTRSYNVKHLVIRNTWSIDFTFCAQRIRDKDLTFLISIFSLFLVLVLGLVFGALWALDPEKMKPYESNFGLVITIILCFAAEGLIVKVPMPKGFPPIPPLLGNFGLCFCVDDWSFFKIVSVGGETVYHSFVCAREKLFPCKDKHS